MELMNVPIEVILEKYYVIIDNPKQIESEFVKRQIESFIKSGAKTGQISLCMQFVGNQTVQDYCINTFKVLKNQIAFRVRELEK